MLKILTILSIGFGILATLVVVSVVTGFQKIHHQAILGFNSHLILFQEEEFKDKNEIDAIIAPYKDKIISQTPFIFREGLGVTPDGVKGVVLKGIDPLVAKQVYAIEYKSSSPGTGSQSDPAILLSQTDSDYPPVILGETLLKDFFPNGIKGEGMIKVLIPKASWGDSKNPKDFTQKLKVVGTFKTGLYEFDSKYIFSSLELMQQIFSLGVKVTGFEVSLVQPSEAPWLARHLSRPSWDRLTLVELFRHANAYWIAKSWNEANEDLFKALKLEKIIFILLMIVLIVITTFSVAGFVFMNVIKRKKDILILKALGLTRQKIYHLFAKKGTLLGLLGIGLGSLTGFLLLYSLKTYHWFTLDPQIYMVTNLPIAWPFTLWIALCLFSLLTCYGVGNLAAQMVIRFGKLEHVHDLKE